MKSQEFLCALVEQLTRAQGCYSEKDVATVRSRVAHEGEPFLEIALPRLDDALLIGLTEGVLPSVDGWHMKKGYRHPEFLHGLWMRVFSPDGSLLPAPSIPAIRAIRQISRAFKKVFEVCSDERVEAAKSRFVEVDRALSRVRFPRCMEALTDIAQQLFGGVVGRALVADVQYRHGPGSVADGLDTVERWVFPTVSSSAMEYFGADTFRCSWSDLESRPPEIEEIPGRLEAVPKTALKPRLISLEPSYNQFLQQRLGVALKEEMARFPMVDITNQERNKALARIGSLDGSLATVDLSDASDRLSYGLIRGMFGFNRAFIDYVDASRSRSVSVDGRVHLLNKFASMGSALTFPVQTMAFAVIAVYASCVQERNFSRQFVRGHLDNEKFGVYGDDIIVPSPLYPTLVRTLTELGLAVNTEKSFSTGLFRESCGGDYYTGCLVAPVYVRRRPPESARDVESLVSWSAMRNLLVEAYGYGAATEYCDKLISSYIEYPAALYTPTRETTMGRKPSGVCRVGPEDHPQFRWNDRLQRLESRIPVLVFSKRKTRDSDGHGALFKSLYPSRTFSRWGEQVVPSRDHVTHHGRPVSAKLKHRWVASVS